MDWAGSYIITIEATRSPYSDLGDIAIDDILVRVGNEAYANYRGKFANWPKTHHTIILKQLGSFAKLNHKMFIVVDPTPVEVDHDVLADNVYSANHETPGSVIGPIIQWKRQSV